MKMKYTLEDEDGTTVEVSEEVFALVKKVNDRAKQVEAKNDTLKDALLFIRWQAGSFDAVVNKIDEVLPTE